MDHDYRITGLVIGCAIEVHKALGPGLKEGSYLKITGLRVGLILNFNCAKMTDGIKRVVL